jgi:hypothetical protein
MNSQFDYDYLLKKNNVFNEDQILEEIITSWEKLKLETSSESYVSPVVKNDEPSTVFLSFQNQFITMLKFALN